MGSDSTGAAGSVATASPSQPQATPKENSDKPYKVVEVFYGTDRRALAPGDTNMIEYVHAFRWVGIAAGLTLILYMLVARFLGTSWAWRTLGAGCVLTLLLAVWTTYACVNTWRARELAGSAYGNERGELQVGVCQVSIPPGHKIGALEAPSILRLEIEEDPLKHVVLLNTAPRESKEFYEMLRQRVAASPQRDLFVFVHGYNVSFEQAARRTAQMSHDLDFEGAPVFYSWPSQAGLFKYTVDETNVEWTVPHLRDFLVDVARNSGAKSISLVAHSMGNRALTNALKSISYRLKDETLFREVVLTAPDIDAEIFKRDIAPLIVKTADRVTLYASSNDEALAASRKIHGAPRAGDSGSELVIIPGMETIDVSAVDTSLLGHSYYGENATVLADLLYLVREGKPAGQRTWLERMTREGLPYWVLRPKVAIKPATAPRG